MNKYFFSNFSNMLFYYYNKCLKLTVFYGKFTNVNTHTHRDSSLKFEPVHLLNGASPDFHHSERSKIENKRPLTIITIFIKPIHYILLRSIIKIVVSCNRI